MKNTEQGRGAVWAIVLAAGEGSRLRGLTTGADGRSVPKQFCSLRNGRSLLGDALARARRIATRDRTVTVVAAEHRAWWAGEVDELPERNVVVQPRNRGTAVGVLLPLLAILERDPDARVVLIPSDHYVRDEEVLATAMRVALEGLARQPQPLTLLGITPDGPESDYGWIVPGAPGRGVTRGVERFVEKPDRDAARELLGAGAVWNSFLVAARGSDLLALYHQRLPGLAAGLAAARGREESFYETLEPADFSRELLQGAPERLRVLAVPPCGWTDLGTPARVVECLSELAPRPTLSRRRACLDLGLAVRSLAARPALAS